MHPSPRQQADPDEPSRPPEDSLPPMAAVLRALVDAARRDRLTLELLLTWCAELDCRPIIGGSGIIRYLAQQHAVCPRSITRRLNDLEHNINAAPGRRPQTSNAAMLYRPHRSPTGSPETGYYAPPRPAGILTARQAAHRLRVHRSTVHRLVAAGVLTPVNARPPGLPQPGAYLLDEADITALANARQITNARQRHGAPRTIRGERVRERD